MRTGNGLGVDVELVLTACKELPGSTMDHPFGPEVMAFKVAGKVFALLLLDAAPPRLTLKCDPHLALAIRERLPAVVAGYRGRI